MNRNKHDAAARWASAAAAAVALMMASPGFAAAQSPCGESVTVTVGDTLNRIAARCETTVRALVRANPSITNPDLIHVGQVIDMPDGRAAPPNRPSPGQPDARTHTVSPGETLAGIAVRYGTSVSALVGANPDITNPNIIHVGQVIRIPGARAPEPRPPHEPRTADASIEPATGPPGTRVRVTGSGFPTNAEVRVGRGRARSEYELTGRTRADAAGRVDVTIPLPPIADPGERWVFVLVTPDRSVEALSEEFLVTSGSPQPGDGRLQITGTLTREGVECPALRGDDDTLYTLAGDIRGFGPGDRVHVHGSVAEVSICQQGTTVEVESIRAAGG